MLNAQDKVIKVIEGGGVRTASFQRVESDDGRVVRLVNHEHTKYHSRTHNEIEPAIPGFRSYLVLFDADQEERVSYPDNE